ncbi:MAG: hypothetical protein H7Z41_19060, partial [Cytophagales bacterium]|nr:hypothetical protein [Armatimonadota bacterium]
ESYTHFETAYRLSKMDLPGACANDPILHIDVFAPYAGFGYITSLMRQKRDREALREINIWLGDWSNIPESFPLPLLQLKAGVLERRAVLRKKSGDEKGAAREQAEALSLNRGGYPSFVKEEEPILIAPPEIPKVPTLYPLESLPPVTSKM